MAAQNRRTSSGLSSTRNAQPWLNPALGARTALASARSTTAGSTGAVAVVADHAAAPDDVLELHGASMGLDPVTGVLRADVVPTSRPVGRSARRRRRLLPPAVHPAEPSCARLVPRAGGRSRGLEVEADEHRQPGRLVAARGSTGRAVLTGSHLDSVLDGGAYDGPLGVVSALAAVDVLRCAGLRAGAADRGVGVRRGGGVAVRAGLPGLAAGGRGDDVGPGAGAARPRRRGAADAGRRGRRAAGCWTGVGVLRGAARRAGPRPGRPRAPRSGWPARSGRTGATASTSPARPTTPARRGWRTAPTRCSPTR